MTVPNELLAAARAYLGITWEDPEGDETLRGILLRGMRYLDRIAGKALDYAQEDDPRALLLDYARYVRAGALDEFQTGYLHELLSLQIREGVTAGDPEEVPDVP